jgi:DNA polymerase III subunit delta
MATATSEKTPQQILKDITGGKLAPVYFLQGEEDYFIDKTTQAIEHNALSEAERSFNQVILYGKDTTIGTIVNNARRFPMMAERVVVIVREAQDLPDLNKEEPLRLLEAYLQQPQPTTILVFAYKHGKLDSRKAIAKTLKSKSVFVTSDKIKDYQLPTYIKEQLDELKIKATDEVVRILAENIGSDLSRVHNELEKVKLNIGKKGTELTAETVHKFIGISRDFNILELQKALLQRDIAKANQIIVYFSKDPKSHPAIGHVAMLFSFFTKLLTAHGLPNKSAEGIASGLGIAPFIAKEYALAVKTYPANKVMQIIGYLREADLRTKGVDSASMSEYEIMQELIYKILH